MNHTQSKVKFNTQTQTWQVLDDLIPYSNRAGKSLLAMRIADNFKDAMMFGAYEPCALFHYLGVEKMDL